VSGYLVSLVQRARGEGAALQPRVRARFEPRGFDEVSAEREIAAPVSVHDEPRMPVAPLRARAEYAAPAIDENLETRHVVHTTRTTTTRAETPASEPVVNAPPIVVAPPVPSVAESVPSGATGSQPVDPHVDPRAEPDGLRARRSSERMREIEIEIERERERLVPHPPLRVQTTRSVDRHTHRDTTRVVTPPHEEDAEPQPIRITIGRIDVRAIAPPAQSRPSTGAPKRNAPLTLDDYLRRRDGEKR